MHQVDKDFYLKLCSEFPRKGCENCSSNLASSKLLLKHYLD
jgi:hypothetical protein